MEVVDFDQVDTFPVSRYGLVYALRVLDAHLRDPFSALVTVVAGQRALFSFVEGQLLLVVQPRQVLFAPVLQQQFLERRFRWLHRLPPVLMD